MRRGSIAANIFLFSALWLIAALAATAFLLTELYSRALDSSLIESLEFHIESLVGISLTDGAARLGNDALSDPRFQRPASGWYWQVRDAEGGIVSFSSSLVGSELPGSPEITPRQNPQITSATDAFGSRIRMVKRRISIAGTEHDFIVTGNLDEIYAQVSDFRGQTLIVLGAVGAMLAAMSALVARFALRPVTRLRGALEQVREGEVQTVRGSYPAELAPLAEELNELLRSNAQIIERARSQVGNLAHGLKTPIAVLRNEANGKKGDLARIVFDQSQKMADLVAAYLDRARLSARTAVVGQRADTGAVLKRLVRVMEKIHDGKSVRLDLRTQPSPWFRGEESDLEEMIGNLLDNACKWAKGRVSVAVMSVPSKDGALAISVEDDGPGLDLEDIERATRRGVRLDEKTPGSGLGLDIVKELVDVYGGNMKMERAASGGLRVIRSAAEYSCGRNSSTSDSKVA